MDWRLAYDARWLTVAHLGGEEKTVKIEKVEKGELTGRDGSKTHKLVLRFVGKDLPWAVPKTNCALLAKAWGNDASKWVGKSVVLYPTTVLSFGENVEAIRARVAK